MTRQTLLGTRQAVAPGQRILLIALAREVAPDDSATFVHAALQLICHHPVEDHVWEHYRRLVEDRDRVDSDLLDPAYVLGGNPWLTHEDARWEALDTLTAEIEEFEARMVVGAQ